jgi:adenylate cyclase
MFASVSSRLLQSSGRRRLIEAVIAVLALVALWLLSFTPQWRQLEFKTFDAYTVLAARGPGATPLVIVAIDEPTFRELRLQWPFPRRTHAGLIDRLAGDGARVIAFDLLFAEPTDSADDARMADAIRNARNVVLASTREKSQTSVSREWTLVEPIPQLLAAGASTGEVGIDPDADFVVRMMPSFADSFGREIARLARGSDFVPAPVPGQALIRYEGPHGTFPTVHYYQALLPGMLPAGFFKDKIALIGLDVHASPELTRKQADLYNSPFLDAEGGVMPGVEIHANIISNLLQGRAVIPASPTLNTVVAVILVLGVGLVGLRRSPAVTVATLMVAGAALLVLSYVLFAYQDFWLSPLLPIVAAALLFILQTAVGFLTERRRAQETKRAFAQYVPAEVVNRLIEQPELLELGGEERELTLLFADLANFTTMSEKLAPRAVVAVLGKYFDSMSTVIYRHGGTVDKYIGDGIMAFWGAPLPDERHAEHALNAAVDMQRRFAKLARRLGRKGGPVMSMRIGIHTGNVIVGNVGSRARFAYTAIGDAVNLASRLEGANKAYGTSILLSEATVRHLEGRVPLRPVDSVMVKGRTDAVAIFTPCADAALADLSRAALDAFNRNALDRSLSLWRELLAAYPADGIATAFANRIEASQGASAGQRLDAAKAAIDLETG